MKASTNQFAKRTATISSNSFARYHHYTSNLFDVRTKHNTTNLFKGDNITAGQFGGEQAEFGQMFGSDIYGGIQHFLLRANYTIAH